jgi:trimeric autotransporter adhesin
MRKYFAVCFLGFTIACWSNIGFAALTAHWSFDTDFTNQQGNTNLDGTAIGTGTSITNSVDEFKVGSGALRIDNALDASDYVDVTDNVLIGQAGSIVNTVVAWYRYDDIGLDGSDERNFVWETAPSSWALSFGIREDGFDKYAQWYTMSPSTGAEFIFMPAVNDNSWHHAAVVIDEANELLTYYHDGYFYEEVTIEGLSLTQTGATGFHIGSHRAGDGARNWDGYIDDVAVFSQLLSDAQIQGLYLQTMAIGDIPTSELTLSVNRDTRVVTLMNNTGSAINFDSYSMTSTFGGLDPSLWTSIAATGDADNGGSIDPINTWSETASTNWELAETSDAATGTLIENGQTINLGVAWIPSTNEDLFYSYISGVAGEKLASIVFTGNSGSAFAAGDLDFDGDIDANDWTTFLVGHGGDFADMSPAQAYGLGDLDGDLDNDMLDFLEFEVLYDAANSPGAFAKLTVGVPEPNTLALATLFLCAAVLWRRQNVSRFNTENTDHGAEDMTRTSPGCKRFPHSRLWSCLLTIVLASLCATSTRADLVASWTFDDNFNASHGGLLFDLNASNGATAAVAGGEFGNAARFDRASNQYAFTSGDVLSADSDFSYSAWYNFDVADIIGSDRYFVLETTAGDAPSGIEAWTASVGLRDISEVDSVQIFTSPSTAVGDTAITANTWQNIIVTFDADGGTVSGGMMSAYLNGSSSPFATYDDVASTTAVGGLVIGGHRAGTGRNFNGLIDDIGFFDHVLTGLEISTLQTSSVQTLAPAEDELTLYVDRTSGSVTLTNTGISAISFNSYQIDSTAGPGSLDPTNGTGWNSLDDQHLDPINGGNNPGETWDEGVSVSANRLIESFLLGSTTLAPDESLALGNAYNETVDAQDLMFRYNSIDNGPYNGLVEYITSTADADFDNDGDIDGTDFLIWQRGFGSGTTHGEGDANADGVVNSDDLAFWQSQFGSNGNMAAATTVPEPNSIALLLLGAIALFGFTYGTYRH